MSSPSTISPVPGDPTSDVPYGSDSSFRPFLKPMNTYVRIEARVKKTGIAMMLIPTEASGASCSLRDSLSRLTIQTAIPVNNTQIREIEST
jgi:hypothetical protein